MTIWRDIRPDEFTELEDPFPVPFAEKTHSIEQRDMEGKDLHSPENDGDAFAGGAVTFLVGGGALICPGNRSLIVDFGGLLLRPCVNK
jgi:hypothetical protein